MSLVKPCWGLLCTDSVKWCFKVLSRPEQVVSQKPFSCGPKIPNSHKFNMSHAVIVLSDYQRTHCAWWSWSEVTMGPQEGWGSMAHRGNTTQYTEWREHTEWTVRSDIRQTLVKPRWNLYTRTSPAPVEWRGVCVLICSCMCALSNQSCSYMSTICPCLYWEKEER